MENSDDFIVITVNGPDAPGIVSSITSILSENAVKIIMVNKANAADAKSRAAD